jgi:hypothetical protein
MAADRTFDDDTTVRTIRIGDRPRHLDHVPTLRYTDLERGVVQIEGPAALMECADRLVDAPIQSNEVTARPQGEPAQSMAAPEDSPVTDASEAPETIDPL